MDSSAAARSVVEEIRRWIVRLHALGWTDAAIAVDVGRYPSTVTYHRRRLGLPSNRNSKFHRRRIGEGVQRWLKSIGCQTLAQIRHDLARAKVSRAGWPAGVTPRQAVLLAALRDGPLTLAELAKAAGTKYRPHGCFVAQAAARLARLGLVDAGWGPCDGADQRLWRRVYRLSRAVLTARRDWERGRR